MKKVTYKMKTVDKTKESSKQRKADEELLKDLLTVLPTLRKHKMHSKIQEEAKKLRSGRNTKSFSVELSREFNGKNIVVTAPIEKDSDKFAIIRTLKDQIRVKIQEERKNNLPPITTETLTGNIKVKKMDAVYIEDGSFFKAMMKKIRSNMGNNKNPVKDSKENYIGVEIELAAKEDREAVMEALFAAGLGKFVCVKNDGSIGSEGHTGFKSKLKDTYPYPHEICILGKETEIEELVNKFCKVVNSDLHVGIDKTCGLHVHVDMRHRDPKVCFANLVNCQQFLYAMLPAARRSSKYSYPVRGTDWKRRERYHGVNAQAYDDHRTLELRMHSGTTNSDKINNWIKLLVSICNAPAINKAATTVEEFQQLARIDDKVIEYVKKRISHFADQHKKTVPTAEEPGTMPNLEEIEPMEDGSPLEASEDVA